MKLALYDEDRKVFTTDLESLTDFTEEVSAIRYNGHIYVYLDTADVDDYEEIQFAKTEVYELV